MKKVIFFFLLGNSSLAMAGLDPLCNELGNKWKLFPFPTTVRDTINNLQNIRTQVDKKVNEQIAIWKKIDGVSSCLQIHAGIMLTKDINGKDYLHVTDTEKLTRFRLAKNNLDCDLRDIPFPKDQWKENIILGVTVKTDYLGTPNANPAYKSNQVAEHRAIIADTQDSMKLNNSLGDVGLENYCAHHLQNYQLEQKSKQIMDRRTLCEAWKKDGTILKEDQKPRGGCEDFPDGMAKEMNALATEMEKVFKETGYQPYDKMTKFDQNLYSSFGGNIKKLKTAQIDAEKSMKWSYDGEKYLKNNDMWTDGQSLSSEECGKSNPVLDKNFIDGQNGCEVYTPIIDLNTTSFTANIDVVKSVHREKMIKEVNAQAFAKTVESSFHLLEYGDQSKKEIRDELWNEVKSSKKNDITYGKACLAMASQNLCSDPDYYKQFKVGIHNAVAAINETDNKQLKMIELMKKDPTRYSGPMPEDFNSPGVFLRHSDEYVATEINDTFTNMRNICSSIRNDSGIYGDPEVKAKWLTSYYNHLRHLQNFAGYFYHDQVRDTINLDKWTANPKECPSDIAFNNKEQLTPAIIKAAKTSFLKSSEEQLQLISDFQKPNRGEHSNNLGALACGKNIKEKNDLYALSSLLTSHPYLTGQMISAMKTGNMNLRSTVPHTIVPAVDQTSLHVEQRIYMSLLCEAKECSSNVKEFNQYAKATVKVSAIAVSLLPLPGASFIGAALSVGADAALLVTEYDSANKEAKLMEGGALAGGFGNNYNPSFADRIKSIKSNEASADRLILGIGNSILDEVLTMGSAEIATLGLTAVISKALETTNPVGSLRTLIFPLLKAAETTADLSQKTLIRQTITKLKKPGVLENVVDKSIKSVEVTKDLNEAFDDLPSN